MYYDIQKDIKKFKNHSLPKRSKPYIRICKKLITIWDPRASELTGPCWIYQGSLNYRGHGQFSDNYKKTTSHRWMFEKLINKISNNSILIHLCHNKSCCNPWHLKLESRSNFSKSLLR